MASIFQNLKTDVQYKASTGLNKKKFEELAEIFKKYYTSKAHDNPYSKPACLTDSDEALFFILYYLKVSPTFQVLGLCFGISNFAAHTYKNYILPYLKKALEDQGTLVRRIFESQEDFDRAFEGVEDVCVDGFEIPIERDSDYEMQKDRFSGKKKRHTLLGLVITDLFGRIIYMTDLYPGSQVDFSIFKFELTDFSYEKLRVWVDLGFQGIKKVLKNASIRIPFKKKRNKPRTEKEKLYNTEISRVRVRVEHSIGGMRRYGVLQIRSRLKKDQSITELAEICAGLWNFNKGYTNNL